MFHARNYSGQFFLGRGRSFSSVGATPDADTLYAVPFDQIMVIDAILVDNSGGGDNGPAARLGLYDGEGAGGLPGGLIEGSGEISMADGFNGHRIFELAQEYTLTGKEWVAAVFSGDPCALMAASSISFTALASQEAFGNDSTDSAFSPRNAVSASYSFAALPSTFPSASAANVALGLFVRGA